MNWSLMIESIPVLLSGALVTVRLLALTLLFGALLALPLGIVAANGRRIFRLPVMGYITFFRGTPLLVQVFLVYYGLAQFPFIRASFLWPVLREAWVCALLTLALHTAAYTANTLPQAFRIGLPAYGNEMISMLKATSLASTITIMELTGTANTIVARTYAPYEVFISAALIYLCIAWGLARLARTLEARLSSHMRSASAPAEQKKSRSLPIHAWSTV